MKEFKSVQDLIVKAALYDSISTTISAEDLLGKGDTLRITFSRDNRYICTHIDLADCHRDKEEETLYCCKHALYKLLCGPYEEINYPKENNND